MRILLVEDNENDAILITNALEHLDCIIVHVTSFSEALIQQKKDPCDVVLLDVNLPDSKKENLADSINALKMSAGIVIVSGFYDGNSMEEVIKLGADDFINKNIVTNDKQKFLLRINIAWTAFKARVSKNIRSGDIDTELVQAQKRVLNQTNQIRSNRDKFDNLSIEQNLQIMMQLVSIEKKVDHTNGTVRDHTKALAELELKEK